MLKIGLLSQDIDEILNQHGEFNFPVQLNVQNLSSLNIVSSFAGVFLAPKGKLNDQANVVFKDFSTLKNFITDMTYIAKAHSFNEFIQISGLNDSPTEVVEEDSSTEVVEEVSSSDDEDKTVSRRRRSTK